MCRTIGVRVRVRVRSLFHENIGVFRVTSAAKVSVLLDQLEPI